MNDPQKRIFFSVIIPVYEREELVMRAVQSVAKQNYPLANFECVVIDDGSSRPHPLLSNEQFQQENFPAGFQFSYHHFPKNRGVSWARNIGLKKTSWEWITFLDSDDEWLPDKLIEAARYVNKHPHLFVFQTDEEWVRKGMKVNPPEYLKKISGDIFIPSLERCLATTSSMVVHRELLSNYPWDEGLRCCEDYDLWIRLAHNYEFGLLPTALTIRYQDYGGKQLSLSTPVKDRYRIYSLKKVIVNILREMEEESKFAYIEESTKQKVNHALEMLVKKSEIVLVGMWKRKKLFAWLRVWLSYKLWSQWAYKKARKITYF